MFFIICFFLSIHLLSYSQEIITTTTANCDDKLYMSLNGKWKQKQDHPGSSGFSKTEQLETFKRLDAIHQLVFEAYPEPKGLDAVWSRFQISDNLFAYQINYTPEDTDPLPVNGIPLGKYSYAALCFKYYCSNDAPKREVRVNGETGTWVEVGANDWYSFMGSINDTMTIDGRPVFFRSPVKETWKGYQMLFTGTSSSSRTVLIHRDGILPYIPVTRGQYLTHCIKHVPEMIMALAEGYAVEGDKEKKERMEKMVGPALKRYQDELEKTTRQDLLDSAAVVFDMHPLVETPGLPIFATEGEGGKMLITENPDYIRKDLPKYVPQFFILHWTYNPGGATEYFGKRIEEYFPIEKLQAMIDK